MFAAVKGDLTRRQLRLSLAVFFLALAMPTAALVYHAYRQLKWESFHQYRGLAEELTRRIDGALAELVDRAESASFADYRFLVVAGDPSANFLQRSELSAWPLAGSVPGAIGYFQVDNDGEFSTPLLPPDDVDPAAYGIARDELANRRAAEGRLFKLLSDDQLVQGRGPQDASPVQEKVTSELQDAAEKADGAGVKRQVLSQAAFDRLNQTTSRNEQEARPVDVELKNSAAKESAATALRKVSDLKLSSAYDSKTKKSADGSSVGYEFTRPEARGKRYEQIVLPEEIAVAEDDADKDRRIDLRQTTFESEIDPFEFSLLGSGDLVLYRKVWRDGERYIQGLVIDQAAFLRHAFERAYRETALSRMSNLIVAYQDDVLRVFDASASRRLRVDSAQLSGALLYQNRLSAPLDRLELIFSIERLPPGPGAPLLGWVSLILGVVLCGGFYALYRLGLRQIDLAGQQRDFVSAVSHELKTPLTSIRMYGEILKEGWADQAKKKKYYEFIFDESERLSRLISNVLQLSRLTRNELQIELRPTDVGTLLDQVAPKITSQAKRAGFDLRIDRDADADGATIRVDGDGFAQMFINLVDNAIKFSADHGDRRIDVLCRRAPDGQVAFSVRDYGPGVPKDQMKKIFERFYRSENELTRQTTGTGIGLAIVHQLATAMGGSVDVLNRSPGAEFRLSLPVVAAT